MKFLLLNGPKRCGKSTGARMLADIFHCPVIGFSWHLKRMVHGVYLGRAGWDLEPDAFDAVKEEPQDILGGMSWRRAYIHYSEQVIKPLHGKEWFGEQFLRAAAETNARMVVIPDSGFAPEAEAVIRRHGAENVRLVRLHREGCDFSGDSRSYVTLPVRSFDVENNATPGILGYTLAKIAREFLDEP